ncbi:MAG TPA: bifunctional phosphopantothenoylcysteine decarboxylase/phosphopantothenate--cysteine ligase CoaBC, partial [Alphaproteobacteria bacterium]|nr:bifunctional phosphopantothenoylcysteine decarboxylase/phosphopantothenate--cysteine ligase CoaBC [Alphaproteobacteria bacterium]
GIRFVEPAVGDMACGEHGPGRLPDVPEIVAAVSDFFAVNGPLRGRRAIVTSGPTHESIDPVRFIGNISSGRQGHAIAAALAGAGADVTLISGPVQEPPPAGIHIVRITTAQQMLEATLKSLPADIAIFTAAVADYRPAEAATHKIKKSGDDGISLALVQNPDILRTVATGDHRPALVVGFAAETDAGIEDAKKKLARKGCDWLVLNDVAGGKVFGQADNTVTVLKNSGKDISADSWPNMSKQDVARRLVAEIAEAL